MMCPRCKRDFPSFELRSIPKWLQVFSFPFWLKSRYVRREVAAQYCQPCRRSLNAALFFIAFFVAIMLLNWLLGLGK